MKENEKDEKTNEIEENQKRQHYEEEIARDVADASLIDITTRKELENNNRRSSEIHKYTKTSMAIDATKRR